MIVSLRGIMLGELILVVVDSNNIRMVLILTIAITLRIALSIILRITIC